MYKNEKSGKIGIIITSVILICLVVFSNINNNLWSNISSPFTKITMSIQGGFSYLKNKISKNDEYFTSLDSLKEQNKKLKSENEDLKKKNEELEVLKFENKTLRESMGLSEKFTNYETIPGYVIQTDFSNYSKIIVINLGKSDGIEKGMTVVSAEGLVGHVISVEDNSSKVQTIVDTASAVSGLISNTDKTLVTRGIIDSNSKIKGTYIDNDVVVNEGDSIYTSGIGGIYPKNIIIGKVSEIVNTQNKTNRYVYIQTAVDFNNLTNILVIRR